MGMKNISDNVKRLIDNGRDKNTPVALIRWGTRSNQETLVGKLEDIDIIAKEKGFKPPAVMVVGEIVRLRDRLNWFENRPLFGKRILVTRAREQASELAERIRRLSGDVVEFPAIEIVPTDNWRDLDDAIKNIDKYDWIIFTSINGVKIFLDRLKTLSYDIRHLKGLRLCAIGPKTSSLLESLMINIDIVPSKYRAESIIEEFKKENINGKRILLPRAKEGRDILPKKLRELGAIVDEIPIYKTIRPNRDVDKIKNLFMRKKIDIITFTSSSTVKNFIEMFKQNEILRLIDGVKIASIGPVTSNTLASFGINPDIMPEKYTIPGLVEAILDYYNYNKGKS
jgi:uroporphyrinogen III methyltransferase/synthase